MSEKPEEAAAAVPAKSKMPLIVMAVGVLCMAGAGGIVFFGNKPAKADKPHKAGDAQEHADDAEPEDEEAHDAGGHGGSSGAFNVKVDPFIANLAGDDDDEMHYIKCSITIELAAESAKDKLEKKLPRVRQDVLLYLSGLTMAQTNGGESKKKLRDGIHAVVKNAAGKALVKNVYVVELVVQ